MDATPEARALARKLLSENSDLWFPAHQITDAALVKFIEAMDMPGASKEIYLLECKRLKEQLSTDKDGPLENLLVGQVVLAWARQHFVEQEYTRAPSRRSYANRTIQHEAWRGSSHPLQTSR